MNYLDRILAQKRREVKDMSLPGTSRQRPPVDPVPSLHIHPIIAEVKKASPSRGAIRADLDPVDQARRYEAGGAGMISVLTDEKFFSGGFGDLAAVAAACSVPLLCKDFIIDEVQVDHAYAAGADCILLIAAALDRDRLVRLAGYARERGLEILFELHGAEEYDIIADAGPRLVGVNARNLKTFAIDRDAAALTVAAVASREDVMVVAESGIETADDIALYARHGARAFLVGTALVTAPDPGEAMAALLEGCRCS